MQYFTKKNIILQYKLRSVPAFITESGAVRRFHPKYEGGKKRENRQLVTLILLLIMLNSEAIT